MTTEEEITELMIHRLDHFIRSAFDSDPEAVHETYAAAFGKNSFAYVDYLDLNFVWTIERAWTEHIRRPSNSALGPGAKWSAENWTWYEDCPHQMYHAVILFNGERNQSGTEKHFEKDRVLQAQFLAENPGDREIQHVWFIERTATAVAAAFRKHPVCTASGISGIPLFFNVPGCPNYGEEFLNIWKSWNPDGLPSDCLYA